MAHVHGGSPWQVDACSSVFDECRHRAPGEVPRDEEAGTDVPELLAVVVCPGLPKAVTSGKVGRWARTAGRRGRCGEQAPPALLMEAAKQVAGPAVLAHCFVHVVVDLALFMHQRMPTAQRPALDRKLRALADRVQQTPTR